MPTGFTAPIEDLSKPYDFNEFVWNCARAFDIWCRDNDGNPPIERQPDTSYETEHIKRAEVELAVLAKISDEALQVKLDADHEAAIKRHEQDKSREEAVHDRHVRMRRRVEEWEPPTEEHTRLKSFMLEQLDTGHFNYWRGGYHSTPPEKELAAEYRVEQVKDLNDSILRYEEKIREAIASTKATNDYFRALFESVPQP